MKFSEKWLREWINPSLSTDELVQQITMAGLEVDAVEPVAKPFTGMVVAEVQSTERHPDAERLSVCLVSDGSETYQIVCGAPNVRQGLKVPLAKIGAVLPGDFKIKKAKLRGVESQGMLCSEEELSLAEKSDGLMELDASAPLGMDMREYLQLDDSIIDVDLTPNRSDCLSLLGLAREVGALNDTSVRAPEVEPVKAVNDDKFPVTIDATDGCPRYVGRVIRNVDVSRPTPVWMVEKLRRSGIRSIDPVVDITNFVMLELGQPMHAFDLAELSGGIVVRYAKPEEKLTLLDGQEVELSEETLLIADQQKPLALAGIMGGEHSGVSLETRDIFLESAFFSPLAIAGKARSYGLHTDASHRFERGVDYAFAARAVERATQLLLEITGGEPGPTEVTEDKKALPEQNFVRLRYQRVEEVLGLKVSKTRVEEMLARLDIVVDKVEKDGWTFKVPTHRFDISIEVDLIEEIARIYGYNNLPITEPMGTMAIQPMTEHHVSTYRLKTHLVDLGYREIISYSFVDPKLQDQVTPDLESIALANPISSDMAVMRTTLWPGLLEAARYNQNRQQTRIRLFETGLTFVKSDDGIVQEPVIGGLISGTRDPESWAGTKSKVDFFDAKGDVESLLGLVSDEFSWKPAEHPALHPGQSAAIVKNGKQVGLLGAVHPKIAKVLNLNGPFYLFELFLNEISEGKVPSFQGVSKFPEIRRDIAVVIDEAVSYQDVADVIVEQGGEWRTRHQIFDLYEGESLGLGKKSLAIGIVWRHKDRTLRDEEVNEAFDAITDALGTRFGATLRS